MLVNWENKNIFIEDINKKFTLTRRQSQPAIGSCGFFSSLKIPLDRILVQMSSGAQMGGGWGRGTLTLQTGRVACHSLSVVPGSHLPQQEIWQRALQSLEQVPRNYKTLRPPA